MRLESLSQDVRLAFRSLFRSPAFSAVAILSLALGIGANISIFTIADTLLFKPMAVPAGERLIRAYYGHHSAFSYADFADIRKQVNATVDLAAVRSGPISIGESGQVQSIYGEVVTDNYFRVLSVPMAKGRAFTVQESHEAGAHQVVILSDRLWRQQFNAADDVVGRVIRLNGAQYSIIGVATAAFRGTHSGRLPELWLPMSEAPRLFGQNLTQRDVGGGLYAIGQLLGDNDLAKAKAALGVAAANLARDYPKLHRNLEISVDRARGVPAEAWPALATAGGGLQLLVTLVMLIACSNVVNVVLARATVRRRELAVRSALGASRQRLTQQLFTESVLLAIGATVVGVLLSMWLLRVALGLLPAEFPIDTPDVSLNFRVMAFAGAVCLVVMLVCGLWPALRASSAAVTPSLRGSTNDQHHSRLRSGLLVAQVSMCTMLLIGSGLFLRSLLSANAMRPGFDVERVLDVPLDFRQMGMNEAQAAVFVAGLRERVAFISGVEAVSMARLVPLSFDNMGMSFSIEGREQVVGAESPEAGFNIVDSDYFATLGIPVVSGRPITVQDIKTSPFVVVVNETMARTYWPAGNAIGQRLGANVWGAPATVVGVVRDSKYTTLGEAPKPFMYMPFSQHYSTDMVMQVRTPGNPRTLMAPAIAAVTALAPNAVTSKARTLADDVRVALLPAQVGATLLGAFGLLALLLSLGGVFGVVSFTVAQRTREIGIRAALGGTASDIARFVLTDSMRSVAIGLGVGLIAALGAGQLMATFLYGVSALDPVTFIAVPLVFVSVAAAACVVPVRRAVRVDPLIAIREE